MNHNAGQNTPDLESARSWHLAESPRDELVTSFEFALMQVEEAYHRWCVQAARLVGSDEITFNEVVVLHVVRMQERAKDAATIAKLVNRDDLPNVLYNLRKLVSLGLIEKSKIGSGTYFQVTERGREETNRYAALRRQLLLENMEEVINLSDKLNAVNRFLHVMTGFYDNASRETNSINPRALFHDFPEPASLATPAKRTARTKKQ